VRETLGGMDRNTWGQILRAAERGLELQPPARPTEIAAVELRLGTRLPDELRGLYEETDGIYHKPGQWFTMWRLSDLANWNLEAWNGWESEDRRRYLGFGDDGTGNPFCVELAGGPTIFTWSPIEQIAWPLAQNLRAFWVGWLSGEIRT
jgi:cell wall assembly regulator SMI1